MTGATATSFADALAEYVRAGGWSVKALSEASGASRQSIARALHHQAKRISEQNVRLLAGPLGVDADQLAALAGYAGKRSPLLAALEARRISAGLSAGEVAAFLGVHPLTYGRIRMRGTRLTVALCGRAAAFLNIPIEEALRLEHYWERLTPLGRIIVPALLASGRTQADLIQETGVHKSSLYYAVWHGVAWANQCTDANLQCWAAALNLDVAQLHRAVREIQEVRGPRTAPSLIQRLRHQGGRKALRARGKDMYRRGLGKLSRAEQRVNGAKGAAAIRMYFASMTTRQGAPPLEIPVLTRRT